MGIARQARPVNLFCGLISNDRDLMSRAIQLMTKHLGPTDARSDFWPFDSTDYYELEMGEHLERQFVSFDHLMAPEDIVCVKRLTNDLEVRICADCGVPETHRRVNLDPGYLTLSKVVLATTKDFSHRVYLRDGIYAESTLHYEGGGWLTWPWTYPDFGSGAYDAWFDAARERLRHKLKDGGVQRKVFRGPFA